MLDDNNIDNISYLAELRNLKSLYLSKNHIEDVTPLSKLENLNKVYLDSNPFNDGKPLLELKNLQRISLDKDKIDNIKDFNTSNFNDIVWLKYNGEEITDFDRLKNIVNDENMEVKFKDPKLEEVIRDKIDKPQGKLYKNDVQ
ncbi:leucine-rich repeat domain-containing protein [Clostridium moutaii]